MIRQIIAASAMLDGDAFSVSGSFGCCGLTVCWHLM